MENESRFCVGFYCGLRSTQRTVVIESIIELTLIITCRMYKVNFFSVLWRMSCLWIVISVGVIQIWLLSVRWLFSHLQDINN